VYRADVSLIRGMLLVGAGSDPLELVAARSGRLGQSARAASAVG
jgi:hypothetical protein